jgi:hypothetical protein
MARPASHRARLTHEERYNRLQIVKLFVQLGMTSLTYGG